MDTRCPKNDLFDEEYFNTLLSTGKSPLEAAEVVLQVRRIRKSLFEDLDPVELISQNICKLMKCLLQVENTLNFVEKMTGLSESIVQNLKDLENTDVDVPEKITERLMYICDTVIASADAIGGLSDQDRGRRKSTIRANQTIQEYLLNHWPRTIKTIIYQ